MLAPVLTSVQQLLELQQAPAAYGWSLLCQVLTVNWALDSAFTDSKKVECSSAGTQLDTAFNRQNQLAQTMQAVSMALQTK